MEVTKRDFGEVFAGEELELEEVART